MAAAGSTGSRRMRPERSLTRKKTVTPRIFLSQFTRCRTGHTTLTEADRYALLIGAINGALATSDGSENVRTLANDRLTRCRQGAGGLRPRGQGGAAAASRASSPLQTVRALKPRRASVPFHAPVAM